MNARYDLALALAKTGNFDEAIDDFKKVLQQFPKSARPYDQFGGIYARAGRYEDALVRFRKARALDPANNTARRDRDWALNKMAASANPPR